MKMPTIHAQQEPMRKSLCGKRQGLSMSVADFKKEMKKPFFLGGCGRCIEIIKAKSKKP